MRQRIVGRILLVAVVAGCFGIPAEAEAGPLLDWLFRRRQQRRVALMPTDACGCGAAYCEQTVVNYIPQTAYRTVWQPVPVTTYKRTTRCNPATGLPITCTQPCTTYTYQARRVPYTTYRPVYSTVPVTVPAQNLSYMPPVGASACNSCSTGIATSSYAAPASSSCCGSSPGYSVPSSTNGSYASDSPGATPWERVEPTPANGGYDDRRDSSDPADRSPSLDDEPIIQQNSYSRALRRIPSTSRQSLSQYERDPYYDRSNSATDYRRRSDSNFDSYNDNRSRTYDRQTSRQLDPITKSARSDRQNFRSDQARSRYAGAERDTDRSVGSGTRSWQDRPSVRPPSSSRSVDIRPVPNLDEPSVNRQRRDIPPLLNTGRFREASIVRPIPTRWEANKIHWHEVARVQRERDDNSVRQASAEAPVRPLRRDTTRTSNDSRWQSNSSKSNRTSSRDSRWTNN